MLIPIERKEKQKKMNVYTEKGTYRIKNLKQKNEELVEKHSKESPIERERRLSQDTDHHE